MEKCKLTDELLNGVIEYIKSGYSYLNTKTKQRRWYDRWHPELVKGVLYYDGKPLIPESQVTQFLEAAVKQGMPLSRDSAFKWLSARAYGFKRKVVQEYLQSLEAVQLLKKRPFKNYRRNLTQTREGDAQVLLAKKFGGKTVVGVDLIFLPRSTENYPKEAWTKYKYLYCAVVQQSGFCFCYPMARKTAVEARRCARLLVADFKKKYGLKIETMVFDLGTEFMKEHKQYLQSQAIKMMTVSKVWWVERKNSQLMRQIAFLREGLGYKWQHAFENALAKINSTYNRKIKMTPESVTGEMLKKGLTFHNRKLPLNPRPKKQPNFKKGQRVRHLLKSAMDVNTVLWKSYNAFRDRKTHVWSKTVYKIQDKRKKGRLFQYQVNNKWFFPYQLQLVKGEVIKIQAPQPVKRKVVPKPKQKVAKAEISQSNLRRGTRVRKKTQFYGR